MLPMSVTRDNGARQWDRKGPPLCLRAGDAKLADKTGDGVNTVRHFPKP
jgi:predicted lipoprotein with Yx(FWY)xxD motif